MSKLYIVPTPIGNLKDITFRAIDVLKDVDLILAEDTRTSGKLLKYYEISTHMQSHHMHNEHKTVENIIQKLKSGTSVALISDAGTPAISDPGFLLSRACIENNIEVDCLPGATAFVPALVNSGLPNDKFVFEGFLPVKKGRQTRLLLLAEETRTMIFYESPHKLIKTLGQFSSNNLVSSLDTDTCLSSPKYSENCPRVLEYYTNKPPKGEIVVVVGGKSK